MDPQLAALCNQTVTVYARTGANVYGEPTFSTSGTAYDARVVPQAKEVRDGQGNVVMSSHTIWLVSTSTVSPESKWVLPDGTAPKALNVTCPVDENGTVDHVKATLGF